MSEPVAEVKIEPDYWSRGHFYKGKRKEAKLLKAFHDLPVGAKLYAATQPAEQHPAPDVEKLVEALEHIIEHWNGAENDQAIYDALWHIKTAQNALAAYRKQGGGV